MNRDETTILASSVKKVKTEDTETTRLVAGRNKVQVGDLENDQPSSEKELSFGHKLGKTAAGFAGGILLGGIATVGTAVLTSSAAVDQEDGGAAEGAEGAEGAGAAEGAEEVEAAEAEAVVEGVVEGVVGGAEEVVEEMEMEKNTDNDAVVEQSQSETPAWVDDAVEIAQGVGNEMSFPEAFRAAREEVGAGGAFEWRGNVYSTYTKEEWDGMSAEEKQEYNGHFDWSRYQADAEIETEPMPEPEPEPELVLEPMSGADDVEILGLDWDPETGLLVGEMAIGDTDVYLIDLEPGQDDGTFDVAVVDINGDGEITEDEIIDVSEQKLSVDEFADLADDNPSGELYAIDKSIDSSNDADYMFI